MFSKNRINMSQDNLKNTQLSTSTNGYEMDIPAGACVAHSNEEQSSEFSIQTQYREQFNVMRDQVRQMKQLLSKFAKDLTRQEKEFRRTITRAQRQSKKRVKKHRNQPPNTFFSSALVNYIKKNLTNDDIHLEHDYVDKETGERHVDKIDIENIDTKTLFVRPDCTKILQVIFDKKNMSGVVKNNGKKDRRYIKYYEDKDFVNILMDPSLDEETRRELKKGKRELTIFNMQRYLRPHLETRRMEEQSQAIGV